MIVADTHIHIYPTHDFGAFLKHAYRNLDELVSDGAKMVCMAESASCNFFGEIKASGINVDGYSIEQTDEPESLRIVRNDGSILYIVAGRQLVTSERLEVLALGCEEVLPDRLAVREAVKAVRGVRAMPVLSWAPGKWLFGRGKVVRSLIDSDSDELVLGDTALRPTVWAEPLALRRGAAKGLRIIAGSDPLPPPGEEQFAGTYGTLVDCDLDKNRPMASFRSGLTNPKVRVERVGRRGTALQVFGRLQQHKEHKQHG